MAVATPRRSPRISVTSPASMAMSVPVPIAMPTSACASAGASLMPSPTIATTRPSLLERADRPTFPAGAPRRSRRRCPPGWRRRWPSPAVAGEHHDANAHRLAARATAARFGSHRIGDRRSTPPSAPSSATKTGVSPRAPARHRAGEHTGVDAASQQQRVAEQHAPSTSSRDAAPAATEAARCRG